MVSWDGMYNENPICVESVFVITRWYHDVVQLIQNFNYVEGYTRRALRSEIR